MSLWVWAVFLVLALGISVLAVRMSRRAREDPFADVPRDEGTTMLAPRERDPGGTAPVPTERAVQAERTSLEERLKAAATARAGRGTEAPRPERVPVASIETSPAPVVTPVIGPIVALEPSRRGAHERRWRDISEALSRSPGSALADADAFLRQLMMERGFPTDIADDAITEAAVAHPDVMDPFRLATAIAARASAGRASDEELRRAVVHVRDLVTRLFADDPAPSP